MNDDKWLSDYIGGGGHTFGRKVLTFLQKGYSHMGKTVTCPPHHWDIDMEAADDVCLARCKKCGQKGTFPATIWLDSQYLMTVRVGRNTVFLLKAAKKSCKRTTKV